MPVPTRPSGLVATRCFRTTIDGRVPLTAEWPALFAAAQRLPRLVLQSRHTSARLIAVGALRPITWDRHGARMRDETGALHLRCEQWAQAWGRLEVCDCCGSPGRIEILNTSGAEFLQLCGGPGFTLETWSELLNALAPVGAALDPLPATGGACLPLLDRNSRALDASPEALAPLLAALGDDDVPICCTLATGEACHVRTFCPRHVAISGGALTVHEPGVTCQLALPAVTSLAAEVTPSGWALHAAGPGGTQLLTFSAASVPGATTAWAAALEAAFPELG